MQTLRRFTAVFIFSFLIFIWNPQGATAGMVQDLDGNILMVVDWSWDYVVHDLNILSADSWDVAITITNESSSDRDIYLSPYSIDGGYYYESFFEFQSNSNSNANTAVSPGETIEFNLGVWSPVNPTALAPYVNNQARPKFVEVSYYDHNGYLGGEGTANLFNPMVVTIHDGVNLEPYDSTNPGQGFIVTNVNAEPLIPIIIVPPVLLITTPIPSSIWFLACGLLGLSVCIRRCSQTEIWHHQ